MYGSIVVGTDGSPTAIDALARATGLAKALSATLHVVSAYRAGAVADPAPGEAPLAYGDARLGVRGDTEVMLAGIQRRLTAEGLKVEIHAIDGDPVPALLGVARDSEAQLIVVGNKGMQGARRVLGSVPNSISHQAPCDVLIVNTA
jgi:nucleotide-binding universal stress UspA family protein